MNENKLLKLVFAISGITLICFASLFVWLQGEIEQNRKDFQKKLVEISNEIKLRPKSLPETVEDEFKKLSDTIEKSAGARIKELADKIELENSKKLNEINEQFGEVINLANNKISGNEKLAKKAFDDGKALAIKNPKLATMMFLNAINHSPDNYEYIEGFINQLLALNELLDASDLNQAISVLQVSLYQVPSDKMEDINGLLKSVLVKQDELANIERKKSQVKLQIRINNEGNALLRVKPQITNNRVENEEELRSKLENLQELRNTLLTFDENSNLKLQNEVMNEIKNTSIVIDFAMKMDLLNNCIQNGKKILSAGINLPGVALSIQTGNSILAQIYSSNIKELPIELQNSISMANDEIINLEHEYLISFSKPFLIKINSLTSEFKTIEGSYNGNGNAYLDEKFTSRFNAGNIKLKEINEEFYKISDQKMKNQANIEIDLIMKKMSDWQKARYQAYQEWVVKKCSNTLEVYKDITKLDKDDAVNATKSYFLGGIALSIGAMVEKASISSDEAEKILKEKGLCYIKADLLTPEVNTLYNDIVQKLFIELSNEALIKHKKEFATVKKINLEDF